MVLKIGSLVIMRIDKCFYDGQLEVGIITNYEKAKQQRKIMKMFKKFGSLYFNLNELSCAIIKSDKLSPKDLEYALELAQSIDDTNCDFRVYGMKKFIITGIESNL